MNPMRILLVIRPPNDGAVFDELHGLVRTLRASGHTVRVRVTFERHDALRFARAAARRGYDLIVAAGGDGTINEVVNGIVRSNHQPRLGILPIGTANDFATGLGLPLELREALQVALSGEPLAIDVGQVNRRCFVNVSTGGFGAVASQTTPRGAKKHLGKFAYLLTGAKELVEMEPASARFVADQGEAFAGRFMFYAVGNARRTGGGNLVTPLANERDARLDVLVVPELSKLDFVSLLPDLHSGAHIEDPDVVYFRTSQLRVEAETVLSVNADGEPMRGRNFDYAVLPRSLRVMTSA